MTTSEKLSMLDRLMKFCGRTNGNTKQIVATIFKAREGDDGSLFVEGCLAAEEPDFENEVMDYDTSKPHFKSWNKDFAQKTGGLSVGNLRGQHNSTIAAGKFVQMDYDDETKKINVVAKVIDPNEQEKVREGVYTSFSIGAQYAKKWRDGKYMRWTAKPFEGSLCDMGSMPSTRGFTYCAADGHEEQRSFDGGRRALREAFEFSGKNLSTSEEDQVVAHVSKMAAAQKGLYTVSRFADLVQSLTFLRDSIVFEREQEGDDSPVTDRVSEATNELLECLAEYCQEQVSEEIGKNEKEASMDVKDLVNQQGAKAAGGAGAAKSKADEPTEMQQIEEGLKTLQSRLDALKAKKKDDEKCKMTADECKDEDCPMHGKKAKEKAAADDAAVKVAAEKAAAGSGEVTLKRADVEQLIETKLTEGLKPIGESLQVIGEAVKAMAAMPAASGVHTRGHIANISKDQDNAAGEGAQKTARELAQAGDTVGAIRRIRETPNFVTDSGN